MLRRSLVLVPILAVVVASSSAAYAAFPGENGDIAVNRRIASLRIVSPDGVIGPKLGRGYDPAWSPDGTRIAFQAGSNASEIWTVAPDGTDPQLLAGGDRTYLTPAWSPDGEHIVVVRARTGDAELRVLSYPDGSAPATTLTHSPGFEETPAWSPDGTKIAYSYDICEDGGCGSRIAVYDLETSTRRFVTEKIYAHETQPDWSPDGSTIVFASNRHNLNSWWDFDIYTVPADGGAVTRILNGKHRARNGAPVWSPDGTTLLYTHETRQGRFSVQSIRWDGTEKRHIVRIRFTYQILFVPDWQAVPTG